MKSKKIIVCISASETERVKMMQKVIVKLGFALINSDAGKLIRKTPHDFDHDSYFIFASSYNFRESPITTNQLFERALTGEAVVLGCKKVQPEFEFMCKLIYPEQII